MRLKKQKLDELQQEAIIQKFELKRELLNRKKCITVIIKQCCYFNQIQIKRIVLTHIFHTGSSRGAANPDLETTGGPRDRGGDCL